MSASRMGMILEAIAPHICNWKTCGPLRIRESSILELPTVYNKQILDQFALSQSLG